MQRARGWVRTGATAVVALVGTPVLLVLVAFWVVAPLTFQGCDVELGGAKALGVRTGEAGSVTVETPPCGTRRYEVVQVRVANDGPVLWRAHATTPQRVERLTVGASPAGFRDVVPLAAPLDAHGLYDVELYSLSVLFEVTQTSATTSVAGAATSTTVDRAAFALIGGGTASFRPADLRPDRIWFDGALVTADQFAAGACEPDEAST